MKNCADLREQLSLYLDNELQGEERTAFEAHARACQSCASLVEKERTFLTAIRSSGPLQVASPELRAKVAGVLRGSPSDVRQPARLKWILPIAAAVLVLLVPFVVWRGMRQTNGPALIGGPSQFALIAAESHLRYVRGQLPLEMESTNPQDISVWFANKVGFNVKLPSYQESSGQEKLYTLKGARLVGYENDYAAYVAYRMKERPISLVITSDLVAQPSGGEEIAAGALKFHYNAIEGLKVLTWSDRGLTYALVSDLEERGQQSCIVCHAGAKDRDFIEPLKPH